MIRDLDGDNKQMGMDQMQKIQDMRTELLASIKSVSPKTKLADTTIQDLLQSIQDLKPVDEAAMENLSLKLTDLSIHISKFTQRSRMVASEQAILKSLRFKAMRLRHSNIVDTHSDTFNWIFETNPSSEHDAVAFNDWLERQSGLYWIVGKAGSGKSTLMKFLFRDRRTKDLLQKWSADRKLVMAQFFFWNSGTMMQKSQEGLLQSLIYEVLRQCPELLSKVCSSRFLDYEHYGDEPDMWTRTELLEIFDNLLRQGEIPVNFCFFIDGLDEYDGDHVELTNLLNKWPISRHFKLCVSSRPWYIFRDAFGQEIGRHLTLENFTRHDIQLYVRKIFDESDRFKKLSTRDPRYNDLIGDIDEKAQGVFLWVSLVAHELLKGFTNADTISVLQKRLKALPPRLEDYFRHIFNQIEEIYRKETVRIFQIALEAREPLPLMIYSIFYEEADVFSYNDQVKRLARHTIEFREDEMKRRLDGCCRGLLEVHKSSFSPTVARPNHVVEFLHRTTRDFLLTKDMQLLILSYVGQDFNPRTWLSNAFLYHLKQAPKSFQDAVSVVRELVFYCRAGEVHDMILQSDLLDQAEQTFLSYAGVEGRANARALFISAIVKGSLLLYTSHKLSLSPGLVHAGHGLLDDALWPWEFADLNNGIDPDMVRLLLEHGASPNQKKDDSTVWGCLIQRLNKGQLRFDKNRSLLQVFDLLLRYGADFNVRIVVDEEFRPPRLTGRAADLQKRGEIIKIYKGAMEVLRERFGDKDSEWLLSRAQKPRVQKIETQKSGFFSFLGW